MGREIIMNPTIAILAGGLATRLSPLTETTPKALVPVAGEPFAFHQLRLLARNGFSHALFLIGHMGERIVEAVGRGEAFGIDVRYLVDGPVLLGTGGALARALPMLGDPFAVIYGDSWLDFDYGTVIARFEQDSRPALMTVFRNEGRWDTSNVEFSDTEIRAYSKTSHTQRMTHIDYGFSLFRRKAFEDVPTDRPTDLAALFEDLAARGELAGHEVHQRFYEVGTFAGLAELENHLSKANR